MTLGRKIQTDKEDKVMAYIIGKERDDFNVDFVTTTSSFGTSTIKKYYDKRDAEKYVEDHPESNYKIFEI